MEKWISPYNNDSNSIWCKGAIHIHTSNSHCGKLSPDKVIEDYGKKKLKYDFISITDHDSFTDIDDFQGKQPLLLIPGVENSMEMSHIVAVNVRRAHRLTEDAFETMVNTARKKLAEFLDLSVLNELYMEIDQLIQKNGEKRDLSVFGIIGLVKPHLDEKQNDDFIKASLQSLGEPDYQRIVNEITQSGGIAIFAHPHWLREDYWERDVLESLGNYTGIEILNGDYVAGLTNIATDTWDRLLSMGRKVWGFGGDDFHNPNEFNKVWNTVRVNEKSTDNIVKALMEGSFYVSTGVELSEVKSENDQIYVAIEDNCFTSRYYKFFRFIGRDGEILDTQISKNPTAIYRTRGDELYARVHVLLETGQMAYTQPFFLDGK